MITPPTPSASRRQFLQFVAASPLFAYAGAAGLVQGAHTRAWSAEALGTSAAPLPSAADAFNVFDLEAVARTNLPIAHFAYIATGVEGDVTLRANREGFAKFQIRSRRLIDTTRLDTKVTLFGTTWPTPIALAPAGSQCAFHPDGEIATARAARVREHLQILSTVTTSPIEDVIAARGAPVWFQLYPTATWSITRALVQRAEAAGCRVVVLTLDNATRTGRETLARGEKLDTRNCLECHPPAPSGRFLRKRMFDGLDSSNITTLTSNLTWNFVRRLQDITSMKVVLKGIVTAEDADLALEHKVDGIIVSNHGGRADESGRSTIESLPEVVAAVGGRIPVLIDSGFRRGTDIFKALALGANAICVGRPYLWGLAAYGQPGVDRCLEILTAELEVTMRNVGTPTLRDITRNFVQRA